MTKPLVKRNILLNPGPATTTDTVKMAQVVPDICPREHEFGDLMRSISRDLVRIVHGEETHQAVLFCGSGTICIDVALSSLLPAGKKILVANNGAYSARAVEVCEYYGMNHTNLSMPIDRPVDVDKVREALEADPDIALVYTTHHETGTGVLNPIREIGALAHEHGCIFVTDTTSSYAMIPIDINEQNVDVCMASAQKGIQGMTGLSYVIARTDVLKASADYPRRSYYCNLYRQWEFFERTGEMHFTPPVQVAYAARQAIDEYFEEGEQAKWERHQALAKVLHEGLAKLGLREVIDPAFQSQLVISIAYPDTPGWSFEHVHDYCYERGFTIYPGKISNQNTFRLCTLGALVPADMEDFLVVLGEALQD